MKPRTAPTIKATGAEAKGRGAAQATVLCGLTETAGETKVNIETNLNLSGMIAQYGRALGHDRRWRRATVDRSVRRGARGGYASRGARLKQWSARRRPRVREISVLRLLWGALVAKIAGWFRRPPG